MALNERNERKGRMIDIRKYMSNIPIYVKNSIKQTLGVHGGKLFNMLPAEIRGHHGSLETFKSTLNEFLERIPDQPQGIGLHQACLYKESCKNLNFLLDWIPYLGIRDR